MPSSSKLFQQVEEALADARILDRDLMRELLDLARALELALIDACRTNLELKAMDRNVATASNTLRDAIDALNAAYTSVAKIDDGELDQAVEQQIAVGRNLQQKH